MLSLDMDIHHDTVAEIAASLGADRGRTKLAIQQAIRAHGRLAVLDEFDHPHPHGTELVREHLLDPAPSLLRVAAEGVLEAGREWAYWLLWSLAFIAVLLLAWAVVAGALFVLVSGLLAVVTTVTHGAAEAIVWLHDWLVQ